MFDQTKSYVGEPLSKLPERLLPWCHREHVFPTIKAMIALDQLRLSRHPVASYTGGSGKGCLPRSFNLPGGGVEQGHSWAVTLARKFKEELPNLPLTLADFQNLKVLALQSIATTRPQYKGKLLLVVAVLLPQRLFRQDLLWPDGRELGNLQMADICTTVRRLRNLNQTNSDAAAVYKTALENLRPLLTR